MRIYLSKRIFMNEADGSPGNGAPANPPAPASPPAQSAAPLDVSAIVDLLDKKFDEKLTAQRHGIFADLRKAGALGKEKPAETPAPAPAAAPASTGLSAADVEAMLEQERVITTARLEHKLSDAQVKRMKSALKADRPDDVSTWASTYLADMGLVKGTEQPTPTPVPTPTPAPTPQPTAAPISDKGSPAPGGAVAWERELAENPVGMSAAAYALMVAKHGEAKARQMRLEAAKAQAARIKVTTH